MRLGPGRLALVAAVAVLVWLAVGKYGVESRPHPQREAMVAAAGRTARAFAVVDSVKRARGLPFPADSQVRWRALLGEDYTPMTTTLGSLPAKEVSTNPAWSALLVRWLAEAGVAAGDTVAVAASGSFPALVLAAVAAVQELEAEPVVAVSLGASSYGANVRLATWLDLETWVREAHVLDVRSTLVTPGGEDDAAGGLQPEGIVWLEDAARRNGVALERYGSLAEAIAARTEFLARRQPAALINIGGGHAALGACPHAATRPVGRWRGNAGCECPARGVLAHMAAQGVPVLHLLRVRELAARHGLDFEPGRRYGNKDSIMKVARPRVPWVLVAIAVVVATLVALGRKTT